jgi:hypothetical protein
LLLASGFLGNSVDTTARDVLLFASGFLDGSADATALDVFLLQFLFTCGFHG